MLYLRMRAQGSKNARTTGGKSCARGWEWVGEGGTTRDVTSLPSERVSSYPPCPRSAQYDGCSGHFRGISPFMLALALAHLLSSTVTDSSVPIATRRRVRRA